MADGEECGSRLIEGERDFDGEGGSVLKDEVIFCCLSIKMTDDPCEDEDETW